MIDTDLTLRVQDSYNFSSIDCKNNSLLQGTPFEGAPFGHQFHIAAL